MQVSSPDLASLKCHAFLCPSPKRAAAPWGVGERDGKHSRLQLSASPPPQFRFSKDTIEEFIIVFQTKLLENRLFKSLNV